MGLITVKLHNRYHKHSITTSITVSLVGLAFVPIVTAFSAIFRWISFSSSFGQLSNNGSFRQVKASHPWEPLVHSYTVS